MADIESWLLNESQQYRTAADAAEIHDSMCLNEVINGQ